MASDDKLPSIDKLNDSNWPILKLQITAYLQAKELWGLVDENGSKIVVSVSLLSHEKETRCLLLFLFVFCSNGKRHEKWRKSQKVTLAVTAFSYHSN